MSYARFSEGDIYLIAHATFGGWTCMWCGLPIGHILRFGSKSMNCWMVTAKEVLEHLEAHVEMGHEVPERAVERIKAEISSRGELWCYEIEQEGEQG